MINATVHSRETEFGARIADVLPKPHRRGDGYIACGNNDVVTWCVGHLLEQAQPDAYDSRYARWSLADLPIIPEKWRLQPRPSVSKQLNAIKKLLLEADEVVTPATRIAKGNCWWMRCWTTWI